MSYGKMSKYDFMTDEQLQVIASKKNNVGCATEEALIAQSVLYNRHHFVVPFWREGGDGEFDARSFDDYQTSDGYINACEKVRPKVKKKGTMKK